MKRPVVLVATTNPAMALALNSALKDECKRLGLKLDICPDGELDESNKVRFYDSAEALFDVLSSRHPMELADTLVILDVGAGISGAFEPKAGKDESWHVTANRAGVAVELILRFPQVFPLILSPAVPCGEDSEGTDAWKGFRSLKNSFVELKEKIGPAIVSPDNLKAFQYPLHFVSPLDGGDGLRQTIKRFSHGMRCWFDPTGLRTLVKNRFLGTVFGGGNDWHETTAQRKVLLDRLNHVAVAIDEEREFAALNAYTAWKFGRRAWMVTTYHEFDEDPLWVHGREKNDDVLILRDIDLRFPDIPTDKVGLRKDLKSVHTDIWRKCKGSDRLGANWRVRAVSSHAKVVTEKEHCFNSLDENERRLGEPTCYIGHRKPLASLYQLQAQMALGEKVDNGPTAGSQPLSYAKTAKSTLTCLCRVSEEGTGGGHGVPYLNLAMAESALEQAMRCKSAPVENIIGALLAGEAYELLLGMSKTTALEALLLMHKKEASAEVSFVGMSSDIDISQRRDDVESSLRSLAWKMPHPPKMNAETKDGQTGNSTTDNLNLANADDLFLSKFWAELKQVYRNGEMFGAAEKANQESLVNSSWLPKCFQMPYLLKWIWWSSWALLFIVILGGLWAFNWGYADPNGYIVLISLFLLTLTLLMIYCKKPRRILIASASSLYYWLLWAVGLTLLLCILYAWNFGYRFEYSFGGFGKFLELLMNVVLTSLALQPTEFLVKKVCEGNPLGIFIEVVHIGVSYVMFGLFISMLYRKITRG